MGRVELPLYEYQCLKCKALIEKIQKFSDAPLTKCEKCGGKLERLLSAPAIQFKGSGWYITDYARKSTGSASESADKSPASEKSSDGGNKSGDKSSDGGNKSGASDSGTKNKSDSDTKTKGKEVSKRK
jgi:putative FmdB family regulatory protein